MAVTASSTSRLSAWRSRVGTAISSSSGLGPQCHEHGGLDAERSRSSFPWLRYVDGDYNDAGTFARLRGELGQCPSRALPGDPAEHVRSD